MSRVVTSSLAVNPSSYDTTDYSYRSLSNPENGYAAPSSSSYASFGYVNGTDAETWIYWQFDISSIPNGATINSVTCQAHWYISGGSNIVSSREVRLFSGTTAKGTGDTNTGGTSGNVRTITAGTWTLSELRNARLRTYVKRVSSGSGASSNMTGRFYGATLTVSYSVTYYSISATSSVSGITVSTSADEVASDGTATITITGTLPQDVTITDNGIDITSSITGSGTTHTYTITNIAEDHVIIIKSAGPTVFLKQNGSWVQADSVFYKQNGVWVQVESMGIKDNGSWIT